MTHSPGTAVAFERVSKVFDTAKGEFTALEDITFTVPTGGISGVVGTSGAGKSTLIRTVNGLETPTSGTVTVLGRQPAELSPKQLRELRREVSMVFQNYNLLETKTVAENVATPLLSLQDAEGRSVAPRRGSARDGRAGRARRPQAAPALRWLSLIHI